MRKRASCICHTSTLTHACPSGPRPQCGARLVLEGPAELRLESASAATLLSGKVVFRGDESALPFDLHTPTSTLVDYGTEYAVSVAADGEEVHVFEGQVQRRPAVGGEEH